MQFDGKWICHYAATGKSRLLDGDDTSLPPRVSTAHCHGDRKTYVYVAATKKCECPEKQKKFVQADKNGKAEWVCIIDKDTVLPLLPFETRKSLAEVKSDDCISPRLELERDAAQVTCRCRVQDLVYGGAGTSIEDKIYCDLGDAASQEIFQALRKIKKYATLDKVADEDKNRFALIIADPKVDIFDMDDGYTPEFLRRRRNARFFTEENGVYKATTPTSTEDDGSTPIYDDATKSHCRSQMVTITVTHRSLSLLG